ncbi:YCF48-related protein [Pseudomonas putida]|uniref:WD40/YVTN/BNR-like repeat-containing protein n=1 Tax=Pseudomonas putida TaxID=303 RepID=UPI000DF99FCE|nr:YCF48-related protein [Pseudomonas putida]SUD78529.1 BNR repeat-containing protein [Pseudomonas putida]
MHYLKRVMGIALLAAMPMVVPWAAGLEAVPAAPAANAAQAMMLGAGKAGERVVAVGDHGMVLLSDDQGRSYRQAGGVPLSSTLTAVSFVDAEHGWAVGHWGTILASEDGGDNWTMQRVDSDVDRPLFAVHFFDRQQGVAVGLWSLILTTDDGGRTWTERTLQPQPGSSRADLNLLSLFSDGRRGVYATAEHGKLLRSDDQGKTWRYLETGYQGSLWSGAVLPDGRLLVGGQRGTLLCGTPDASAWQRIPLTSRSSITAIQAEGKHVLVAGLDGLLVTSQDGGATFDEAHSDDGVSLTAALMQGDGRTLLFSRHGVSGMSSDQKPR